MSDHATEIDAKVAVLAAIIKTEREKHEDLGPEQMVFNVRCTCGHIGQQVSVRGEFEQHVDESVAVALLTRVNPPEVEVRDA